MKKVSEVFDLPLKYYDPKLTGYLVITDDKGSYIKLGGLTEQQRLVFFHCLNNFDRIKAERDEAIELLKTKKRGHYGCDDTWYSCPKHEDGCCNDAVGEDCTCGADNWNKEIDDLLDRVSNNDTTVPDSTDKEK